MATLKELKLDEKTLVIFTSDNGGVGRGTCAPFRGGKGSIFEGGMLEPCIMRWPDRIPAGTTCNQIAGNIDMLPTFAKLTGTVPPQDRALDGRDITPLMFKADAPAVRDMHLYFTGASKLGAIRQGDWKLFLADQKKPSFEKPADPMAEVHDGTLFDLAKDPYETTDVAAAHADIVTRLRTEAQKREKEIEEHRRPAGTL